MVLISIVIITSLHYVCFEKIFLPKKKLLHFCLEICNDTGQEAFVDDIFLNLASAFPGMALPTKELIYQTLEKLTRERKIYQTAQGYFVVTPDTHRYIMSTEPLFMQTSSAADYQANITAANFLRNTILFQQGALYETYHFKYSITLPLKHNQVQKWLSVCMKFSAHRPFLF